MIPPIFDCCLLCGSLSVNLQVMKRYFNILLCAALFMLAAGCNNGRINAQIEEMKSAVSDIEQSLNEVNLNAGALEAVAKELKAGNTVSQLIPVEEEGDVVGYILWFSDNSMVTLYDQPAYVTIAESDGAYCWMVDGEWLTDADGRKRPVGEETPAPQFRTAEGELCISTDGGNTWATIGKVSDRLVESISEDDTAVYLKLNAGGEIVLPKVRPLSISFETLPEIVHAGSTAEIPYTVQGTGSIKVLCTATEGWLVSVSPASDNPGKGKISVTAPADASNGSINVFVTDGISAVMQPVEIGSLILAPAQSAYIIASEGGDLDIELTASVEYDITVDAGWLRRLATKDTRTETIRFQADANTAALPRTAHVRFVSGAYSTEVAVMQNASTEIPELQPGQFDPESDEIEIHHEFRAVWLATLSGMDWPVTGASPSSQRSALKTMMKNIRDCNCNAVIFQVCCNSDTYWPSGIYPWSSVLTGTEGKDPGYDPLEYAIDVAHEYGLELHAWMNPMRIGLTSKARTPGHPMFKHPEWVHTYDGTNYWDPGYPEVREMIAGVAQELIENYEELDGVHMDDYFYPSAVRRGLDGGAWNDAEPYRLYGGNRSLDAWREHNIDDIVERIYNIVKDTREDAIFGISPAGRLNNTQALYADPTHWAKRHTIDYLAPQIYWQIGHPVADFDSIAHFWPQVMNKVPLVPGIAASRYRVVTGFESMDQYKRQIEICRSIPEVEGAMWFRAVHVTEPSFKRYMSTEIYPYPSLIPNYDRYDSGVPIDAPVLSSVGTMLTWTESAGAEGYAVYRLDQEGDDPHKWVANMLYKGEECHFRGENGCNYMVIAYRKHEKSEYSNVVFINYSK